MDITFTEWKKGLQGPLKFNNKHDLEIAKNGRELFHRIISRYNQRDPVDYEDAMVSAAPIMFKFLKKHKKFNYTTAAKNVFKKDESNKSMEIPFDQVCMYLRTTFRIILPSQLFGSGGNEKKVMKGIRNYLKTAKDEAYDLNLVVQKLNLLQISWLKKIESQEDKRKLVSAFLQWFFIQYLNEILRTQFYVTHSFASSKQKVFIRQSHWSSRHMKRMNALTEKGSLRLAKDQTIGNKCGTMRLQYMKGKIRPIVLRRYFDDEKTDFRMLNRFIEQLSLTKLNKLPKKYFQDEWIKFVNAARTNDKNVYLISCDIKDAFESVKLEVLFDIIKSMCKGLPEKLTFHTFVYQKKPGGLQPHWSATKPKQYFVNNELALPELPSFQKSRKQQLIPLASILAKLKVVIFNQKVKLGNKIYDVIQGVLQGFPVSPNLSEMYYRHMAERKFSYFLREGMLHQYADDYFYATSDKVNARIFEKKIKFPIQPYGCRFNAKKTKRNFDLANFEINANIKYIGWKIHGKTLQVEPEYSVTPNRYITTLMFGAGRADYKERLIIFKRRLNTMVGLKLTKIVTDAINSEKCVLRTVRNASLKQAERCFALLHLLKPLKKYAAEVMKEIQKNNRAILHRIQRQRQDFKKPLMWKVQYLLWQSYIKVFAKNNEVSRMFQRTFKRKLIHVGCKLKKIEP